MTTVVAGQAVSSWSNPLSTREFIDAGDARSPRCSRRKITMREREELAMRHREHRSVKERKELAKQRHCNTPLSVALDRMLYDDTIDPQEILEAVAGYKLDSRQSAQVKYLKKQRAGKVPGRKQTFKTREQGLKLVRRKRRDQFVKESVAVSDDDLEFLGMVLIGCVLKDDETIDYGQLMTSAP